MGNKASCITPPRQSQPYRPPSPRQIAPPQRQVVDKNVFYNRELIASYQEYYEHNKYNWLPNVWDTAVNNYKNSKDTRIKDAINQNMHRLIDDHNFSLVRRYISTQMTSQLIPVKFIYIYKLARILSEDSKVLHTAAALVTMKIDIHKATIADSYTGKHINYDLLKENKEYCCDRAEVYAFKIVGEKENVMAVTPKVLDGTNTIVSNFDIKFKYTIGHYLTEPNFGTIGSGCYQGIHFFTNEGAAVKYAKKGMINMIEGLPHVTKSIIPEETDQRVVEYGIIYYAGREGERLSTPTIQVYDSAEAMLRYYNSVHSSDSYRGLKQVCNHMYGDWYLHNNFGVDKSEKIKIEYISDDDTVIVAVVPPSYNSHVVPTTFIIPDEEKSNPPTYNPDVASTTIIPDKVKVEVEVESYTPIVPTTTIISDKPPPYKEDEMDIEEDDIDIDEYVPKSKPSSEAVVL